MAKKLKPSYASENAIPADEREYYEFNEESKLWELDGHDEIARYYNNALAKKRDEFKGEKETAVRESQRLGREVERLGGDVERLRGEVTTAKDAERRAQDDLAKSVKADHVMVPKKDAEELEEWRKLGKLDEMKGVKDERDSLKKATDEHAQEELWREAAMNDASGELNFAAIRDALTHPKHGQGLTAVMEEVEEGEGDDKVKVMRPFIKKENADKTVTKTPLGEFADKHWSTIYNVRAANPDDKGTGSGGGSGAGGSGSGGIGGGGTRMADGGASKGTRTNQKKDDVKEKAKDFNKQRDRGDKSPLDL